MVQRRPVAQHLLANARLPAISPHKQASGHRRAAALEVQGDEGAICRLLKSVKLHLLVQHTGRQGARQQGLGVGERGKKGVTGARMLEGAGELRRCV